MTNSCAHLCHKSKSHMSKLIRKHTMQATMDYYYDVL